MSTTDTDTDTITISGSDFEYTFDRSKGKFTSLQRGGTTVATDTHLLRVFDWTDLEHQIEDTTIKHIADSVVRICVSSFSSQTPSTDKGFATDYLYHILGSGDILLGVDIEPQNVNERLDRIGLQIDAPENFERFAWYGRGPKETYPKRKTGMKIGVYQGNVEEQYVPYVPPVDNGNKTDTRWAALTNGTDTGLAFFGHPDLNVSTYTYSNINTANHDYELVEKEGTTVNLDHTEVEPAGGLNSQLIEPSPRSFVVGFRPFIFGETSPTKLNKRRLPYAFANLETVGDFSANYNYKLNAIQASATVRNTRDIGEGILTRKIPLKIDGRIVDSRTVTLEPGEKTEIGFTHEVGDGGIWDVAIADLEPIQIVAPDYGSIPDKYRTFASTSARFGTVEDELVIDANGEEVWHSIDEYGAIYNPSTQVDAETTTTVKVTSQENTSEWAQAGLMIRNNVTEAGESTGYVNASVTPTNGFFFEWDSQKDGYVNKRATAGESTYPCWLKLERSGNTFTGYYSTDGNTWTKIGSASVSGVKSTQDAAIFVTAGTLKEQCIARFDKYNVN